MIFFPFFCKENFLLWQTSTDFTEKWLSIAALSVSALRNIFKKSPNFASNQCDLAFSSICSLPRRRSSLFTQVQPTELRLWRGHSLIFSSQRLIIRGRMCRLTHARWKKKKKQKRVHASVILQTWWDLWGPLPVAVLFFFFFPLRLRFGICDHNEPRVPSHARALDNG